MPQVLEGLDDKSANRLTPTDQFRILGNNPAMAYFNFGMVFLAAKRNELAVKALEHGMVYDEDNTQISLLLADTLLKLNRGQQALALVDRHIERQTPFVEAYELMARVLKALNREKEITPRLEAARATGLQECSAPVCSGRSLSRNGRERQGRGPLQGASHVPADSTDLPRTGQLALETEKSSRLAQGGERGAQSPGNPGSDQAAAWGCGSR